jgi:DnaJ-domain-containing protein 1
MTKQNRAAKDEVNRRYREQMEEAHEIAHAVMRSRKSKYTVKDPNTGELLVFTD